MVIKDWNIEEMTGYKHKTTFYTDFSIAEAFGISAIKNTYKRAFESWKDNVEYITELVMVLNWKIWEHFDSNKNLAKVYNTLWAELDIWCCENLKGEDLKYYFHTTD